MSWSDLRFFAFKARSGAPDSVVTDCLLLEVGISMRKIHWTPMKTWGPKATTLSLFLRCSLMR